MDWYLLLMQKYGYLAILLGALVEGDISLALGSVLARQGLMNFWLVLVMGLIGSFVSQGLFYFLGRWQGLAVVQRFPRLQTGYPKAHALVQRFGSTGLLIVQYLYGMRLATSFALGTLRIKTVSYLLWLLLAISLWALGIATAGYTFGTVIHYLVSRLQIFMTVAVAVIIALILAYRRLWGWTARQVYGSVAPEPAFHNSKTYHPGRPPLNHRR